MGFYSVPPYFFIRVSICLTWQRRALFRPSLSFADIFFFLLLCGFVFGLCVVGSCESFYPVRLIVKPLPGCGDSCLYTTAYFAAIEGGGVSVVPHWASL